MTELFQIAGITARRGDRAFHNAQTQSLGKRWVKILGHEDALRARVRVLDGAGKGAVPVIQIADLQWDEPTQDEQVKDLYDRLSNGSGIELEALALLRSRDQSLKLTVENESALRGQVASRDGLLSQQDGLLSRCLEHCLYLPDDLGSGISNAMQSFRLLMKSFEPVTPAARLFRSKGKGTWHVAVLQDRVWKCVSDDFRSKNEARKWAVTNGYQLESCAKEHTPHEAN